MFKIKHQRGQNPWVLIFGGIAMLSMLFTIFSQSNKNTLDVYTDSDKVKTEEIVPKEEALDVETTIYTDAEYHFSIEIPADWEEVMQNGIRTFIHRPSASSLQIQVLDYDPAINNASSDTLSTEVVEKGMTFSSFKKINNSNYQLMYQNYKNNTYDYIEQVYWDTETIIKLVCVFNDANYEKIIPYFELILNSFAWERSNAIPEGYAMYYNETAQFEVLVPDTWSLGASGNSVVVADAETGAMQSMTVLESADTLDMVSATDMSKILNTGQSNFMMNSYDNSKEKAVARCTYVVNGVQYQEKVFAFATGERIYFVMFDYEAGAIDETLPEICADSFRSFPVNSDDLQE